jgi:hypothetical protein
MSKERKTDEDGWGCVPELQEAVTHIDDLTNEIYEINNCVRQTDLKVIVEYMQEKLQKALDELEYIDTDVEYITKSPYED